MEASSSSARIEAIRWPNGARLAVCVVVKDDAESSVSATPGMQRLGDRLLGCAEERRMPLTWIGGPERPGKSDIEHLAVLPAHQQDLTVGGGSGAVPRFALRMSASATPYWDRGQPAATLVLPLDPDCADRRMLEPPWWTPDEWLQYAMDAFDCLHLEGEGGLYGLCISPAGVGRSGAIQALQQLLGYVAQREQVWVANAGQIAAHCGRALDEDGQCD